MKPSLCVIDDNEMMCEFLSVYFSKDYQVSTYKSAKAAYQEMYQSTFADIILLDLNIPEFSGLEFLKAVQNSPSQKKQIKKINVNFFFFETLVKSSFEKFDAR